MANKNRKFMGSFGFFLRRKCILTYPMQLGVLRRTSVEPITPGLSQRGRLLGAVAQWQLRLYFFLVFSWRFSSEKCPTLTVASFFFFFRQTTISF